MTEHEKMLQGMWYDANYDEGLLEERLQAEELYFAYNQTGPRETERKEQLLQALFPNMEKEVVILSPIYTDYGYNCRIGEATFINHGAYLMDAGKITVGSHCFIGPNCGMYTAIHAMLPEERNRGIERAKPIVLGDNVWLGGDVTILPGVTIGSNTVIGAGSVVTKDIPSGVVAAGNPCRVMREMTQADATEYGMR